MIRELAYAKINVYLHVVGKRDDGYHDLDSLMVPISLADELEFYDDKEDSIELFPSIKDNIIEKAVKYMKEKFNIDKCVRIKLIKKIPIGAGLGGGSADLSATLRGLNRLWNLGLTLDEIGKIALEFGSDTLFTTYNTPAIIKGRGEKIEFSGYTSKRILLVNPGINVSTKEVFKEYKGEKSLTNDLEEALIRLYPEIKEFKEYYTNQGIDLKLSGSGSSYFAVIDDDFRYNPSTKYHEYILQTLE